MLGALIIVFREVIEAGLIVGIVMAATAGVPGRGRWVAAGVAGGGVGAGLVALFAGRLADALAGVGQEMFNAGVLGLAVVMLAWHNIWMARHGRELATELKGVGAAVAAGSRTLAALAVVVGVAVLREGSEVVLFLYGVAISGKETAGELIAGGAVGLALGAALSALTFFGLVRIPQKHLFSATTALITLLAAGLASQCAAFLQQAGVVTRLSDTAWDTSAILSDRSLFGRVLHTLVGYADQPSWLQVVVYGATLAAIVIATRLVQGAPRSSVRAKAAPAE
ncbi:MAG: FTR1 family protein [Hyphomicrobiales bacterium]|nr:FTR1 family protein [Hyphomicrobiales bacterium]